MVGQTESKLPKQPESGSADDLLTAEVLSSEYFISPDILEAENDRIFRRTWHLFGRKEQVSETGQFLTGRIAGEPVVVVRNKNGQLRAFSNVCRHRAGPVAEGSGRRQSFICRYHGWLYDLDGELINAPDFASAKDFDVTTICLPQFQVDCWGDLVFVCLDKDAQSLDTYLGALKVAFPDCRLSEMSYDRRIVLDVNCNWKTLLYNGNECYHCALVHRSSLALSQNAATHVIDEIGQNWQIAKSTIKTSASNAIATATCASEDFTNFSQTHTVIPAHPGLTPEAAETVYVAQLFPACWITLSPNHVVAQQLIPISAERTQWVRDYFFTPSDSPHAENAKAAVRRIRELQATEDAEICEVAQRNLASKFYDKGRISPDAEKGVFAFQHCYRRFMD